MYINLVKAKSKKLKLFDWPKWVLGVSKSLKEGPAEGVNGSWDY